MTAATAPFVLYTDAFWISPYVFSCFVALTEKGLPFEARTVALHERAQDAPAFGALSATARVPVLVHGDFALSESSAIVEYLEDLYPPPAHRSALPIDVRERARARQIMAWIRSDLMPIREERATHTIFYAPATAPLSPAGEAAAAKLLRAASQWIPADGRASLFAQWSVADADLALMLQRLIASGYAVPQHVRAFVDAQWARPSVRAFVERTRPAYVPY